MTNIDKELLINSAKALLALDASNSLVPHGIGGLAKSIIQSFIDLHENQAVNIDIDKEREALIADAKKAGFIFDRFETGAYSPNVKIPNSARDDVFLALIKFAELTLARAKQHSGEAVAEATQAQDAKDAERMNWLESERVKHGTISFNRHGLEWTSLFTISTQRIPNQPTIRKAIDQAIASAPIKGE